MRSDSICLIRWTDGRFLITGLHWKHTFSFVYPSDPWPCHINFKALKAKGLECCLALSKSEWNRSQQLTALIAGVRECRQRGSQKNKRGRTWANYVEGKRCCDRCGGKWMSSQFVKQRRTCTHTYDLRWYICTVLHKHFFVHLFSAG